VLKSHVPKGPHHIPKDRFHRVTLASFQRCHSSRRPPSSTVVQSPCLSFSREWSGEGTERVIKATFP
jgi:hypothetical protein